MYFLQGLKPEFAHITGTKRGINPKLNKSFLHRYVFSFVCFRNTSSECNIILFNV